MFFVIEPPIGYMCGIISSRSQMLSVGGINKVGFTHRVTVESLGVNVESNWTHVPQGYKNEPELIKQLMNRVAKQQADKKEQVDEEIEDILKALESNQDPRKIPDIVNRIRDYYAKNALRMKDGQLNKEATQAEKHAVDHVRIENSALKASLTMQKYLIEDLKDLVDMFATGNVDLRFYKRVIKDYLNSI